MVHCIKIVSKEVHKVNLTYDNITFMGMFMGKVCFENALKTLPLAPLSRTNQRVFKPLTFLKQVSQISTKLLSLCCSNIFLSNIFLRFCFIKIIKTSVMTYLEQKMEYEAFLKDSL